MVIVRDTKKIEALKERIKDLQEELEKAEQDSVRYEPKVGDVLKLQTEKEKENLRVVVFNSEGKFALLFTECDRIVSFKEYTDEFNYILIGNLRQGFKLND